MVDRRPQHHERHTRLAQEIAGQGVTITNRHVHRRQPPGWPVLGPRRRGCDRRHGRRGHVERHRQRSRRPQRRERQRRIDPGGVGDADLNAVIAPRTTDDAAVLNMTFVPTSPDLQINYVFASEEYQEFVDSQFNDVFAFWVNGVALANNCATVADPGGRVPVTINTINHLRNTQIYVDNPQPGTFDTQFDGFTLPLTCFATVTPNVPNTLKLAVADTSDSILDSAVFLESSGVTSTPKTKYSPLAPQRVLDTRPSGAKIPAGGSDQRADRRPVRRAGGRRLGGPQRHRHAGRGQRLPDGVPERPAAARGLQRQLHDGRRRAQPGGCPARHGRVDQHLQRGCDPRDRRHLRMVRHQRHQRFRGGGPDPGVRQPQRAQGGCRPGRHVPGRRIGRRSGWHAVGRAEPHHRPARRGRLRVGVRLRCAGAGDLERQLRRRSDEAQRGVRAGRGRRPGERVRVDRAPTSSPTCSGGTAPPATPSCSSR